MKNLLGVILILGILLSFSLVTLAAEEITVWAMGAEAQKIGEMVARFEEKYPDIGVTVQAIPWSNAHDKLITAIAGGTGPDVAQLGTTWMAEFAPIGVFAELSRYLEHSTLISREQFFSGSYATNVVDGHLFGIPWYVDTRVLFYRTDLVAEIGYHHPPKNWEQLREIAGQLAQKGEYGLALSTNNYQEFLPFVWQNGGRIFDQNGKIAVTEPAFVEALEFYVQLFKDGVAPLDAQGTDLFQEFAAGRMPMYFSGPWMINLTREQVPEIDGKWSVALMPEKKTRTSFIGGCNLVIFNSSKQKEAAWKFVEFMGEAKNQLTWYKISGSLPTNRHTWEEPYFDDLAMVKVFGRQLEDAKAPLNIPQWAQIEYLLQQRLQEACYGKKSPLEAMEALAQDIEGIM